MNIDELNEKLFPKKWRGVTLSSMDVDYFLCKEEEGPSLSTKSILGHSKWSLNKLRNLIKVKGKLLDESWSLQKDYRNLLMWQDNTSFLSPPDAIMCFDISAVEMTKSNKISRVAIDNHLVWVTPKKRKKSFGSHLVAHFIHYLLETEIHPISSRRGIEMAYYADFYSAGGERLSNYICDFLNYMCDCWRIDRAKHLWPIRSVELECGW